MVTKWTTSKPVIARIVRNVRHLDASYFDDIKEWMAEAIGKMETTYQLQLKCAKISIDFHRGPLPCHMDALVAVEYDGYRLPEGGGGGPISPRPYSGGTTLEDQYGTVILPIEPKDLETPQLSSYDASYLKKLDTLQWHAGLYYNINYNKIESNLDKGIIHIWYLQAPTDNEGFPMIPDQDDYKSAIYWYVRMMMIGSGFDDPVFRFNDCEDRFERDAGRAMNAIQYPTVDKMQRIVTNNIRLIPSDYYWNGFDYSAFPERDYLNE